MSNRGDYEYQQVCDGIVALIRAEEVSVGEWLPTMAQLRTRFASSEFAVRRALDVLKDKGVVEGRWGRGILVLRVPEPGELESTSDAAEVVRVLDELRAEVRELRERIVELERRVSTGVQHDDG